MAAHVQGCAPCAQIARELRQLEEDWRNLPLGVEAEQAKTAFLQKLPELRATIAAPRRGRLAPAVRWAMAAAILIAVGPFLWMIVSGPASGANDIVDELIAWNVALTNADQGARKELAERENVFRSDLAKTKLSKEEHEFAERLLDTGHWIAKHDDPLVQAKKLIDISDRIVTRIEWSEKSGNVREAEREVNRYTKVDEGVNGCIKRAKQSVVELDTKKGWGEIQRHGEMQRQQFQQMFDRTSQPEMKRQFESLQKKARPMFPSQR